MPEGSSPIHVALTFDDKFWAPAFAVMRSICLTTHRRRDLVFHLCVDTLSPDHRADLDAIVTEFGATQLYYEVGNNPAFQEIARLVNVTQRFPPVSYARLVLDKILPPDVSRVIYLDSDTLCMAPIERLYDQDLGDFALGAVSDPFRIQLMMGRDIRTKKGMFDPADDYFNSGMLLIDRNRFAAADITARVREFGERGILKTVYFDQDILNLVFSHNWKKLEWRFNVVDPRRPHQSMDPYIIHYTGDMRPWRLFSLTVPFHHVYRHVMTNELFYRFLRFLWKQRLRKWGRKFGIGR